MTEGKNNDVVLSVKDLHVYFYTNQRCNKVLRGVSFEKRFFPFKPVRGTPAPSDIVYVARWPMPFSSMV